MCKFMDVCYEIHCIAGHSKYHQIIGFLKLFCLTSKGLGYVRLHYIYIYIIIICRYHEGLGFPESNLSPKTQLKFYLLTVSIGCTVQRHFILRLAFSSTAAAPKLTSWFYQSSPLFSFVLHSFLHCHIGDDLRYAHYGFNAKLRQVQ